jgi:hypothetical protein
LWANFDPEISEWGNPPSPFHFDVGAFLRKFGSSGVRWIRYPRLNKIDLVKRTRGTETSQYLEEKTSTEIPLVVASERGPGQCLHFN